MFQDVFEALDNSVGVARPTQRLRQDGFFGLGIEHGYQIRTDRELPPSPKCLAMSRVIRSASLRSDGLRVGTLCLSALSSETSTTTAAAGAGTDVPGVSGFPQSSVSAGSATSVGVSLSPGPFSPRGDLGFAEVGM